jgi:hypothetical protein
MFFLKLFFFVVENDNKGVDRDEDKALESNLFVASQESTN